MIHKSVLLKEVIEYLSPQSDENFVDCTLGAGGHAFKILEENKPAGKLLGIDLSKDVIIEITEIKNNPSAGNENLKDRLILVNDNFVNLSEIIKKNNFHPVNGILLDLGLSSDLLEKSGRGFSFQKDEFLDMRFGDEGPTAYELINQLPPKALEKIFKEYGEEKFAGKIASGVARLHRQQKIKTTFDLKRAILDAMGMPISEGASIKIFARIFQALRIAVNNELENLEKTLNQAMPLLATGGRLVVISFHSLEDRLVKNLFRQAKQEGKIEILTKKPVCSGQEELRDNNRSRSAKLRAARKI